MRQKGANLHAESCRLSAAHLCEQFDSIQSAFRRLFMLEVSKHVAPFCHVLPNTLDHRAPLFTRVTRFAKSVIHKTSSGDVGGCHGLRFSHTKGCVPRLQKVPS